MRRVHQKRHLLVESWDAGAPVGGAEIVPVAKFAVAAILVLAAATIALAVVPASVRVEVALPRDKTGPPRDWAVLQLWPVWAAKHVPEYTATTLEMWVPRKTYREPTRGLVDTSTNRVALPP
jgi:hypothetical protein